MKVLKYALVVALTGLMASCATVTRNSSFNPGRTELQIQMDDLVCVGETEVSVDYNTYLGFIRKIEKINGQTPDSGNKSYTNLNGTLIPGPLNRAYDKVIKQYPDARYFQIVSHTKKSNRLFLGTETEVKAKIRAYKFK